MGWGWGRGGEAFVVGDVGIGGGWGVGYLFSLSSFRTCSSLSFLPSASTFLEYIARSLCSNVIGQIISLFGLSICLLVLVRFSCPGLYRLFGSFIFFLSVSGGLVCILSCCCLHCLPLCLLFCF